jgi:hypothetical protein
MVHQTHVFIRSFTCTRLTQPFPSPHAAKAISRAFHVEVRGRYSSNLSLELNHCYHFSYIFHFSLLYFCYTFEFASLKTSGTDSQSLPRVEGEKLRTIVLVGRTLSGTGKRWGLYTNEALLKVFMMEECNLQPSL